MVPSDESKMFLLKSLKDFPQRSKKFLIQRPKYCLSQEPRKCLLKEVHSHETKSFLFKGLKASFS